MTAYEPCKQNGQMQNIQRNLVDRCSLNGLQVIRLHYNTADDVQNYMTVIREAIKVVEIGLVATEKIQDILTSGWFSLHLF